MHPHASGRAGRTAPYATPPGAKRSLLSSLGALALAALLDACASPAPPVQTALFRDPLFAAPAEHIDADDVLAPSEEMKHFVRATLHRPMHTLQHGNSPEDLVQALYRADQIRLEYDSTRTRNAAQTFAARKGNCLSLVLMTAALAKELNLSVIYQAVDTDPTWSRQDDMAFLSDHVNIDLGKWAPDRTLGYDPRERLVVDFLPTREAARLRSRPISEQTVVAMYMNNRAAEALARGAVDDAYWWARGALARAPEFGPGYNTLGVVYLRHGDLDAAADVLRSVLARDGADRQALSNLAIVVERQGRADEAQALRERLARLEPDPPYKFFLLGRQAMLRGDYAGAREYFAREVRRADYSGEFHYWLGLANLRLGNLIEARQQLTLAMASSTTTATRDLYAAKLARLRAYGVN